MSTPEPGMEAVVEAPILRLLACGREARAQRLEPRVVALVHAHLRGRRARARRRRRAQRRQGLALHGAVAGAQHAPQPGAVPHDLLDAVAARGWVVVAAAVQQVARDLHGRALPHNGCAQGAKGIEAHGVGRGAGRLEAAALARPPGAAVHVAGVQAVLPAGRGGEPHGAGAEHLCQLPPRAREQHTLQPHRRAGPLALHHHRAGARG
eukprot:CAMPEP_0183794732 /NCGR_PEP_ID=MMETSP0803_2-20130417/4016_1 /TAXON_ID=195967 /ORGANISM="Crustomastix stigmata, Strain CCMP3273" /LENGTH=207 /DNA_ID=CAMNT_0026039139 /DNA_START=11 /DNA_END=630 /DNA_ORIENTATION=-